MAEDEQDNDLSFIGERQVQSRRVWNTVEKSGFTALLM